MGNTLKLILSILIPLAIGGLSGFFTASGVSGWYTTVQKPSFNPPNWVFGPVWTTLYVLMGISLYLIWKLPEGTVHRSTALSLFWVQLGLNFLWSFLFFKLQRPDLAFIDIILMWVMILLTIVWFIKVRPLAGWLQVPYLCWVSFASVLNFSIWQLNK